MTKQTIFFAVALSAGVVLAVACGEDSAPHETTSAASTSAQASSGAESTSGTGGNTSTSSSGSGMGGMGGAGGAPDCYMNPKTHIEIINACTDADKQDKKLTLPLELPDGGLPPLP